MAEQPDIGGDGRAPADPSGQPRTAPPFAAPATGTPRWVKAFGVVGLVLALLVVIMLLTGHGPGRHSAADQRDRPAPTASVAGHRA